MSLALFPSKMTPAPFFRTSSTGIAFVVVSACAFGAMAILARFAYASGANVTGVLASRFAIAGVLLTALMLATKRPWPRGRPLAVAIGMGAVGYVGQAVCFFTALERASAGLVALLLYTFPTLVVLLSVAFLGERMTATRGALLAASFAGLALTLGGGLGTPAGIALGLGAAAFYSVYIVVGARELKHVDALASTTVVCLSAASVLALSTLVTQAQFPGAMEGWVAIVAIAAVSTVVAILAFFAGLKRVGPGTASIVSTLEPVVTVALAWAVLGERLAPAQMAGGAIVIACAVLLARGRSR
jgi:drug/metabolite transporter (DMT)-like permease